MILKHKFKKEAEYFYEAVRLKHLSAYRTFRNTIVDKSFLNVSKDKNINLKSLQRSTEFFNIRTNLLNFLKLKKNKLQIFIFPYQWCKYLKVNIFIRVLSHFLFSIVVCKLSLYRVLKVFKLILKKQNHHNFQNRDTVYLFSIPNHCFNNLENNNEYTLISWLEKNLFHNSTTYFHDNKSLPDEEKKAIFNSFLPNINSINKIKILIIFLYYFLTSFIKLFFGKWQNLYLADDYLLQEYFMNSNKDFLKSYIFPYVGTQFCPSWTNVVEEAGSKVYLLNYSASSEPYLDGQSKDEMLFRISSWQNIIPFNEKFVSTLKKNITYPSKIIKTPTVFFTHDGSLIEKYVKKEFVSIFDISPTNPEIYFGFSCLSEYIYFFNEDKMLIYKRFFNDIINISKKFGYQVVLKQKRHDSRLIPAYNKLLLDLQKQKELIILPPSMSPYYVMDNSIASIAQPFTSVGFYTERNKNIAFYDPLEILTSNHSESKGTTLLIGRENLTLWFEKIKNSN